MHLYQGGAVSMRVNAKSFQACNCLTARQAARHVTQFYDRFLALSGLRTTQFSILARLQEQGPMTINALAVNLVLERTTLGRNILPLERDGLIRIERAASDRRSKVIRITKPAERRLEDPFKPCSQPQAHFQAAFTTLPPSS